MKNKTRYIIAIALICTLCVNVYSLLRLHGDFNNSRSTLNKKIDSYKVTIDSLNLENGEIKEKLEEVKVKKDSLELAYKSSVKIVVRHTNSEALDYFLENTKEIK